MNPTAVPNNLEFVIDLSEEHRYGLISMIKDWATTLRSSGPPMVAAQRIRD